MLKYKDQKRSPLKNKQVGWSGLASLLEKDEYSKRFIFQRFNGNRRRAAIWKNLINQPAVYFKSKEWFLQKKLTFLLLLPEINM